MLGVVFLSLYLCSFCVLLCLCYILNGNKDLLKKKSFKRDMNNLLLFQGLLELS